MSIIDFLNKNQGAFIVFLTLVYVIATICILIANNRSVKVSEKAVKASVDSVKKMNENIALQSAVQLQNVRIQLFEKRKKVYNEFQNAIEVLRSKNYSKLTIELLNGYVYKKEDRNNIDFKFMDIAYVFGKKYNNEVLKLIDSSLLVSEQIELCKNIKQAIFYTSELIERDKNQDLDIYRELRYAVAEQMFLYLDDSTKKVADTNLVALKESTGEEIKYNYYDESIKKRDLIDDFNSKYKSIKIMLENELYLNDVSSV